MKSIQRASDFMYHIPAILYRQISQFVVSPQLFIKEFPTYLLNQL